MATVSDPELPGARRRMETLPEPSCASSGRHMSVTNLLLAWSHDPDTGHAHSRSRWPVRDAPSQRLQKGRRSEGSQSQLAADLEGCVLPTLPAPPRRRSLKTLPCCTFCPKTDKSHWIRCSTPRGSLLPPTGSRRKFPQS